MCIHDFNNICLLMRQMITKHHKIHQARWHWNVSYKHRVTDLNLASFFFKGSRNKATQLLSSTYFSHRGISHMVCYDHLSYTCLL